MADSIDGTLQAEDFYKDLKLSIPNILKYSTNTLFLVKFVLVLCLFYFC